jgi:hypothetical protein
MHDQNLLRNILKIERLTNRSQERDIVMTFVDFTKNKKLSEESRKKMKILNFKTSAYWNYNMFENCML